MRFSASLVLCLLLSSFAAAQSLPVPSPTPTSPQPPPESLPVIPDKGLPGPTYKDAETALFQANAVGDFVKGDLETFKIAMDVVIKFGMDNKQALTDITVDKDKKYTPEIRLAAVRAFAFCQTDKAWGVQAVNFFLTPGNAAIKDGYASLAKDSFGEAMRSADVARIDYEKAGVEMEAYGILLFQYQFDMVALSEIIGN